MLLHNGTRVGSFEIVAQIGAGGMGEVYRARDMKLKRDVALKVLPDAFSADSERMARFQREAEVLASLNHPRIAAIYGIESGALVMELVDGETLDHGLPLNTALDYARQIAEALEYAHERSIIHRDLKPANVKVTPDGAVKLLDFGLAKAVEDPAISEDPSASPTLTLGATRVGMILGTAAYMSPEQAQGKTLDRRSDIFSFGAVFYEMLAGRRAFAGESVPDTLASVLKLEPDWSALPPNTPAAVRTLLRRCLTKDRKQRLQAIGEVRIALENPAEQVVRTRPARPWTWIAATAVMSLIAAVALWGWSRPAPPPPLQPSAHFATTLNPGMLPLARATIAVSPDGLLVAYPTVQGIHVRAVDVPQARFLPGTEAATFLSFSPDGQSIAFQAATAGAAVIRRVSLTGGVRDVIPVRQAQPNLPLHWGADGNIYFVDLSGMLRIAPTGGQPQMLVPRAEGQYFPLQILPGGTTLLAIKLSLESGSSSLEAVDLVSKRKTFLMSNAAFGRYAATGIEAHQGHIVFGAPGSILAVTFDAQQVRLTGEPVAIPNIFGVMNISDQGTLAYIPRDDLGETARQPVWINRKGVEESLPVAPRAFNAPVRLSPDGKRLAVVISSEDLWVVDLIRGSFTKVTSEGFSGNPMWTINGRYLIYQSGERGESRKISSVSADRIGPPAVISKDDFSYIPNDVTPDGKAILVRREDPSKPEVGGSYLAFPIDGDAKIVGEGKVFLESRSQMNNLRISPNGRFVAYQSSESRRSEINVTSYPGPGPITTISTNGGVAPHWSVDGRELFYLSLDGKIMVADVQTTAEFKAGGSRVLLAGPYRPPWDLAPDGRFLFLKAAGDEKAAPEELHIITNWFDELRRLAPLPR